MEAIIESGVKILETAGNNPKDFMAKPKAANLITIHKCVSVRHALSTERHGVDAVSRGGFKCAGYPDEEDIGGLVFIPAAVKQLSIPVIGDGRCLAAAIVLCAECIKMGTRFCATKEAPMHDSIKQALVKP